MAAKRFPEDIVTAIRDGKILGIRAGTGPHRFIGIGGGGGRPRIHWSPCLASTALLTKRRRHLKVLFQDPPYPDLLGYRL